MLSAPQVLAGGGAGRFQTLRRLGGLAANSAARGVGRSRHACGLARFAGRADGKAQGLYARPRFARLPCCGRFMRAAARAVDAGAAFDARVATAAAYAAAYDTNEAANAARAADHVAGATYATFAARRRRPLRPAAAVWSAVSADATRKKARRLRTL
jgi:hypothetical protein